VTLYLLAAVAAAAFHIGKITKKKRIKIGFKLSQSSESQYWKSTFSARDLELEFEQQVLRKVKNYHFTSDRRNKMPHKNDG